MAMKYFKSFFREIFDKGGVLAIGVGCLYLHRKLYLPNMFGQISYGIITLGAVGIGRYFIMDFGMQRDRPEDQKARNERQCIYEKAQAEILEQRRKEIIEKLGMRISKMWSEMNAEKQRTGKLKSFLAEEFEKFKEDLQIKPEELILAEQYFRSFEACLKSSNFADDYLEDDIEIIEKHDIERLPENI